MDKKQLKKITTKIYEEYGFVKKGKYYYLDLEDVVICSGFSSVYGVTYLAYNFSLKALHSEEERKLNNMFDGYDSGENFIEFDKNRGGVFSRQIYYEDWTEDYYTDRLKELLHIYFDPYKEDAFGHLRRAGTEKGYIYNFDIVGIKIKTREFLGIE